MCGIIGYIGKRKVEQVLIEGLKRLEYRGYDSAGIAAIKNGAIQVLKREGRVGVLIKELGKSFSLSENPTKAKRENTQDITHNTGIGHTRWATHGDPNDINAHPHLSNNEAFAIVHNGVIENYLEIKKFLISKNYFFRSETDTEVLCNLIQYHHEKESFNPEKSRFLEAVRKSLLHIKGTYGIAVISNSYPDEIIGARKSSPLIVGVGDGENLIASDISAFAMQTRNVVYLNDGEIVHLKSDDFSIKTIGEENVRAIVETIDWEIEHAELGSYQHFMEKEIFEQPMALENALRGRFSNDGSTAHFGGLNISPQELRYVDRILFCACGTAWHACLVAEYLIERYARIPVEVEYASEFRYRNAPIDKHTLVFVMSQSGETLDTLEALREAKRKGYRTMAITNVVGSSIAREADGGIYQHAGIEVGVASTKAFTSQLVIASLVALYLGRLRDMSFEEGIHFVQALKKIPHQVQQILNQHEAIKAIALKYSHYSNCLFLGRQKMFPIALEGALKLKEISYIHAEGYPAAEMKHGPIALISKDCPTIFMATQRSILDKTLSNIQEVKARGGPVIAITMEGNSFPDGLVDDLIFIPNTHEAFQPILATIHIQLIAYYIALARNCDVDKPRNLAKSVTVE